MTTVSLPSGKVTVPSNATVTCGGSGKVTCVQPLQDYLPPQAENLAVWMDMSQLSGGSAPRSGGGAPPPTEGDDEPMEEAGSTARAAPPTAALSLLPRRLDRTANPGAPAGAVSAGSVYAIGRQNGLRVLALDAASAGLATTWGPIGAVWTLGVFVRADRLVDAHDGVAGVGPMTLVASGAVGSASRITVDLPRGGAVPAAALLANGGPLDGVAAGVPFDVACVNQWRLVALRNGSTGLRDVLLDGYPLTTASAVTAFTVASGTAVTVGAGCTAAVAEVLVWGSAVSDAELRSTTAALRTKWGVPTLSATTTTAALPPITGVAALPATPAAQAAGFPVPTGCWLDASCVGTLFADAAGAQPAASGGPIRLWRDLSGAGRHLSFPPASPARWVTEAVNRVGGRPVVATAAAGTFASPPLANGGLAPGGFTALAVWRVLARPAGATAPNGHPLAPTAAAFDLAVWNETVGVRDVRAMPVPGSALGLGAGEVVVLCWERTGAGAVTWRLNNLQSSTTSGGGYVWTGSDTDTTWVTRATGVGASLHLAELMVWRGQVLTPSERVALSTYLTGRWGLTLNATGVVSTPLPASPNLRVVFTDAAGSFRKADGQVASVLGDVIQTWCCDPALSYPSDVTLYSSTTNVSGKLTAPLTLYTTPRPSLRYTSILHVEYPALVGSWNMSSHDVTIFLVFANKKSSNFMCYYDTPTTRVQRQGTALFFTGYTTSTSAPLWQSVVSPFPVNFDQSLSDAIHAIAFTFKGNTVSYVVTGTNPPVVNTLTGISGGPGGLYSPSPFKEMAVPFDRREQNVMDTCYHHYEFCAPALSNADMLAHFNELRTQYGTLY